MNNLTPSQQKMLQTWAEERDKLLRDVGALNTELNENRKLLTDGGLSLADLHKQIAETKGRLAELDALETRMRGSLSIDVAELTAQKSRLEAECAAKAVESKTWDERIAEKISNVQILVLAHDKMSDQATIVDQVVGQVIQRSKDALSEIGTMLAQIRTVSAEVIEKGTANVAQTNIVLEKLPKFIFDLERPIPVRRKYPEGHPNAPVSVSDLSAEATQASTP